VARRLHELDPFDEFCLLGREFLFGEDALVAQFGEFPDFVERIRRAVRRWRRVWSRRGGGVTVRPGRGDL
jgi:hypothetical protein